MYSLGMAPLCNGVGMVMYREVKVLCGEVLLGGGKVQPGKVW
jgi:hypothetical protein